MIVIFPPLRVPPSWLLWHPCHACRAYAYGHGHDACVYACACLLGVLSCLLLVLLCIFPSWFFCHRRRTYVCVLPSWLRYRDHDRVCLLCVLPWWFSWCQDHAYVCACVYVHVHRQSQIYQQRVLPSLFFWHLYHIYQLRVLLSLFWYPGHVNVLPFRSFCWKDHVRVFRQYVLPSLYFWHRHQPHTCHIHVLPSLFFGIWAILIIYAFFLCYFGIGIVFTSSEFFPCDSFGVRTTAAKYSFFREGWFRIRVDEIFFV